MQARLESLSSALRTLKESVRFTFSCQAGYSSQLGACEKDYIASSLKKIYGCAAYFFPNPSWKRLEIIEKKGSYYYLVLADPTWLNPATAKVVLILSSVEEGKGRTALYKLAPIVVLTSRRFFEALS